MGPKKRKGERPVDQAAGRDRAGAPEERETDARRDAIDEREEEGYSQPESSAQKTPPPGPEKGDVY